MFFLINNSPAGVLGRGCGRLLGVKFNLCFIPSSGVTLSSEKHESQKATYLKPPKARFWLEVVYESGSKLPEGWTDKENEVQCMVLVCGEGGEKKEI